MVDLTGLILNLSGLDTALRTRNDSGVFFPNEITGGNAMANIFLQIKNYLVILFGLLALIFIVLGIISSFKYFNGFMVSRKTLKVVSIYLLLFTVTSFLTLIIYDALLINVALLFLIIFVIIIMANYFMGGKIISFLNKRMK